MPGSAMFVAFLATQHTLGRSDPRRLVVEHHRPICHPQRFLPDTLDRPLKFKVCRILMLCSLGIPSNTASYSPLAVL